MITANIMQGKQNIGLIFLCILLVFNILTCSKDDDITTNIPQSRSFLMGFTGFPYDLSAAAEIETLQNVTQNGDVLLAHFDHGVPWNEALNNLPFPNDIQNGIANIINSVASDHKIVLTATSTDQTRVDLAKYWNNNGTHQDLPSPWNTYSYDEPDVLKAYLNYCRRIIDAIKPDYFAYGIEVNAGFLRDTSIFNEYLTFANAVYSTLKQEYPDLPIFLTFQDQSFNKTREEVRELTKLMLPYSDMVAVSTYRFWEVDAPTQDANPELLDINWLRKMRDLAPNKPFAISETGYIAEDLQIPEVLVNIKGNAQWQADYSQKLFAEADKLDTEFILWFVYRDYDLLYQNTPNPPFFFKIWKDNGLLDGNGNRRPAHDVWNNWLALPLN